MELTDHSALLHAVGVGMGVTHLATLEAIAAETAGLPRCLFLDVGCGIGGLSAAIFQARAEHPGLTFGTGLDCCSSHIARYANLRRVHGIVHDLEAESPLPFRDDEFDVIVGAFFLEHLSLAAHQRFLREVRRLTRRFVFGAHRFAGLEHQGFPCEVEEPGRAVYTTPKVRIRLGLDGYYEKACTDAGFATVRKVAAIRYPNNMQLGDAANSEASSVFAAER